jgi:threonine/homoserine/homoserine lactone efflux protein
MAVEAIRTCRASTPGTLVCGGPMPVRVDPVDLAGAVAGFAAVAGLLTIIPGVDTAIVLRTALTRDRATAAATAGGILSGCLVWGVAASVGAAALLAASHTAYTALRLAGACYLLYLGVSMLRRSMRRDSGAATLGLAAPGPWRAWLRGLGVNLLNPKVGVLYVALIPQFIPPHAPHLAVGILLALVHDLEGAVWFALIITAAHTARRVLDRPTVHRVIDRVTGTVLVAFGVRIAVGS